MISSASPTPSPGNLTALTPFSAKSDNRPEMLGADQLALGQTVELRRTLSAESEIRPEVVARAEALARDPDYPSPAMLRDIASRLLSSPDLSEQAD
jgi:hypothetical protein